MKRTTPLTALPKLPQRAGERYRCRFAPPERVGVRTPDGWTDRAWLPGEKIRYAAEVLGQLPITPSTEV